MGNLPRPGSMVVQSHHLNVWLQEEIPEDAGVFQQKRPQNVLQVPCGACPSRPHIVRELDLEKSRSVRNVKLLKKGGGGAGAVVEFSAGDP